MRMWMTKLLCDSLNRTLAKNCSIEKSLVFSVRLRNDLYCVEWGVKLYSLTHSFSQTVFNFFFTCMHKAQKTKLVHASTTASSSSAMLEQARLDTLITLDMFVSTRSTCNINLIYFIWQNKQDLCMQEHKNDLTCTGEHYSSFVVRHVETAWLDTLDKVERVESCWGEPSGIWAYASSPGCMAYYYAELTVSSPAVAKPIVRTQCTLHLPMER